MPNRATLPPARRADLLLSPLGENGQSVVKDARTGEYYHLGVEESFLLGQLNGKQTAEAIRVAFEQHFGEPLSEVDLREFIELARSRRLLQPAGAPGTIAGGTPSEPDAPAPRRRQSVLYWRKNFYDPDRLFTWLAPTLWFFWTRAFLLLSAGCIVLAAFLLWANRQELAGSFANALRWETVLWAWLMVGTVTLLHESAHGLTCKHYGGEVHEIGFLLLFFMPCFYCNVSDAWLFNEKSKRLWVSFAGGYFELFVWALAVFVWRLTVPGSFPNYLAFLVVSASGVQTLFNFNPLLKLDGYYLLSDWLEIPNLQQQALGAFKTQLRWVLWGAPPPPAEPRGKLLWRYGLATWLYSLAFLGLMLWGMTHFLGPQWAWLKGGAVAFLGFVGVRGILQGTFAGEVRNMILQRHKRTTAWLLVLGAVIGVLFVPIEDWAGGTFHFRSGTRAEVRAPVSGFLQFAYCDESDLASTGVPLMRLDIPDLDSKLAQKQAEAQESKAKLKLLEIGPRREEVAEQRQRVERAKAWGELARQDVARSQQTLTEELAGLEKKIAQHRAELEAAQEAFQRARTLWSQRALADAEYREAERKLRVSAAQLEQVQAENKARATTGTLVAETELARRQKELAEAQATLNLLEAGSRAEEIDAERARLARLQHETHYLEEVKGKLTIYTPVSGVVTTPRLREKVGQWFREGDLICVIEVQTALEVEIAVAEQDMTHVRAGQEVALKARVLPYDTFPARVQRLAPNAVRNDLQSSVTVYCTLPTAEPELRPVMTGHARIYTGRRSIGAILLDRVLRLVQTEFWW